MKGWRGIDFSSSKRAAENSSRKGLLQIKFICGAAKTFQGYGMEMKK